MTAASTPSAATATTMTAVVRESYGPPESLRLQTVERPVPGPDDVLVRVHAAGVDQSVWHLLTGLPYLARLVGGLQRPKERILGSDVAGEVVAVGSGVTEFAVGDLVFGAARGSYAEYACARAASLAPLPVGVSAQQGASIAISGCAALHAVRNAGRVRAGERVLVIGAGGGVGSFAVQLATRAGAAVTGVCSTGKVELVRGLGADDVIDYTRTELVAGIRPAFDVIVDTAGHRPLSLLRRLLTPTGRLVLVGSEIGGRWLGGTDRQLRALVTNLFTRQRIGAIFSTERQDDLRLFGELLAAGTLTVPIDHTFSLGEAAAAITYLRAGKPRGKVVLTVS